MLLNVLVFIIVLSVLIFVHELGHFIAATRAGVRVYEFAIGFGPRILSKRVKGVRYSIRLIPLGGFVDLEEGDKPRGLLRAPIISQFTVLMGGILGNLLLAIVMFGVLLFSQGFVVQNISAPIKPLLADQQVTDSGVLLIEVADNPVLKARLPTDGVFKIDKINCTPVSSFDDLKSALQKAAQSNLTNVEISLVDLASGSSFRVKAPITKDGRLGVVVTEYVQYEWRYNRTLLHKLLSPVALSIDSLYVGVVFLYDIVKTAVVSNNVGIVSDVVSSPVALYPVVSGVLKSNKPFVGMLQLIGLLSLNLAIINLIPFPPLDGWHIITLWLRNRFKEGSTKLKILRLVTLIGAAVLILLSVILVIKDIRSLL